MGTQIDRQMWLSCATKCGYGRPTSKRVFGTLWQRSVILLMSSYVGLTMPNTGYPQILKIPSTGDLQTLDEAVDRQITLDPVRGPWRRYRSRTNRQ